MEGREVGKKREITEGKESGWRGERKAERRKKRAIKERKKEGRRKKAWII